MSQDSNFPAPDTQPDRPRRTAQDRPKVNPGRTLNPGQGYDEDEAQPSRALVRNPLFIGLAIIITIALVLSLLGPVVLW